MLSTKMLNLAFFVHNFPMQTSPFEAWPQIGESLAHYVRRRREYLCLSQRELALKANISIGSISRIERGQTNHLKLSTKRSLALPLEIPAEHFDAVEKGQLLLNNRI